MGRSRSRSEAQPTGYFQRTQTLSLSLMYVLPWLLIYEIGLVILQPQAQNAAGVIVWLLFSLLGPAHIVFNLVVMLVILVAALRIRKQGGLSPHYVPLLVVETTVWAVLMGGFAVVFTTVAQENLPTLGLLLPLEAGVGDLFGAPPEGWNPGTFAIVSSVVHSAGAGFYEELVFRLILLTVLIWFFRKLLSSKEDPRRNQFAAIFLAVLISSVLFALAHHLDPANPPTLAPMIFRTVCGAFLAVIFILRGFAAAVYTHTIYDIFVFLVQSHQAGYFESSE